MLSRIYWLVALLFSLAFIFNSLGCETPEDSNIEQARSCVDNVSTVAFSDPTTAMNEAGNCENSIQNDSSLEAAQIKYSVILLQEQVMAKIGTMATELTTNNSNGCTSGSTCSGVNQAIITVAFQDNMPTAGTTGVQQATDLYNYGLQIGGGALAVASIIQTATTLGSFMAGLGTPITPGTTTPSAIASALTNCASSCTSQEQNTIGQAVTTLYTSACSTPSNQDSGNTSDICNEANQILGTSVNLLPGCTQQNTSTCQALVQTLANFANR